MCITPMLFNVVRILSLGLLILGLSAKQDLSATELPGGLPPWLRSHIGEGEGQIAPVVLARARALYFEKVSTGVVQNPCYLAMDATSPGDLGNGRIGQRFYVICEAQQSFRAISSGHGSGRNLPGSVNFSNGRVCAKNFGNALDSDLTAGGAYLTAETKTSFKGYYRSVSGQNEVLQRTFVQFDGEGETANARQRVIGGHASQVLKGVCLRKDPRSPYANRDGNVPVGTLVDYAGGRSNGCTSWSPSDTPQIISLVSNNPTTLYIYPERRDIEAVDAALAHSKFPLPADSYWNADCLAQIGSPRYWPKATLEPILRQYERDHPAPPPRPLPICTGP